MYNTYLFVQKILDSKILVAELKLFVDNDKSKFYG